MSFDHALKTTLGIEGGYSNDPRDRGGETKYGITEATARAFGYSGKMVDMTLATAGEIYKQQYWFPIHLDLIDAKAPLTAEELFDTGVNCGIGTAGKFLQRALSALTTGVIAVDGAVGKGTLAAFDAFIAKRGAQGDLVLARLCNAQQGVRYIEIVERNETQDAFIFGWTMNRVVVK